MNRLQLEKIDIINGKRVEYHYSVAGEWAKYFSDQRTSFIEYDADVSCVPDSVLAIPFVCNILPAKKSICIQIIIVRQVCRKPQTDGGRIALPRKAGRKEKVQLSFPIIGLYIQ